MSTAQSRDPLFLASMCALSVMALYAAWKISRWLREYWNYVKQKPYRILLLPFQLALLPFRLLGQIFGPNSNPTPGSSPAGGAGAQKSIIAVTNHAGRFQVQFNDRSSASLSAGSRDYQLAGYTADTVSLRKFSGNIHHTIVYKFRNGRLVGQTTVQ